LLNAIAGVAALYAPPEADEIDAATLVPESTVEPMEDQPASSAARTARPVTRDDMLRELERVADFFRRSEPHSPLAYTLEEAVRRGRLTWPELLSEVVPDDKAQRHVGHAWYSSGATGVTGLHPARCLPARADCQEEQGSTNTISITIVF
jgi:type VI secretion system protein ImpA